MRKLSEMLRCKDVNNFILFHKDMLRQYQIIALPRYVHRFTGILSG